MGVEGRVRSGVAAGPWTIILHREIEREGSSVLTTQKLPLPLAKWLTHNVDVFLEARTLTLEAFGLC